MSHAAKKPDGHIPRPPNCFLLYRSWVRAQNKLNSARDGEAGKKNEQSEFFFSFFLLCFSIFLAFEGMARLLMICYLFPFLPPSRLVSFRCHLSLRTYVIQLLRFLVLFIFAQPRGL